MRRCRCLISRVAHRANTGQSKDNGGLVIPHYPFYKGSNNGFNVCVNGTATRHQPFVTRYFSYKTSAHALRRLLTTVNHVSLVILRATSVTTPLGLRLLRGSRTRRVSSRLIPIRLPSFCGHAFQRPCLRQHNFYFSSCRCFPIKVANELGPHCTSCIIFPIVSSYAIINCISHRA